jgi:hypothetical protein
VTEPITPAPHTGDASSAGAAPATNNPSSAGHARATSDPSSAGEAAEAVATLDVDGVGAVAVGTILWTVALVLCLVLRGPLTDAGRGWWTWVCLTGTLLGAAGYIFVRRRRAAYAEHPRDLGRAAA